VKEEFAVLPIEWFKPGGEEAEKDIGDRGLLLKEKDVRNTPIKASTHNRSVGREERGPWRKEQARLNLGS